MSELISGKEALGYLSMGSDVLVHESTYKAEIWWNLIDTKFSTHEILEEKVNGKPYKLTFKLKPRTIMLNGIEVIKPQSKKPKEGDWVYTIDLSNEHGYTSWRCQNSNNTFKSEWWRTEEEIKQVVAALRSIFK